MTERVDPILLPGQRLAVATGQTCAGCGHQFADEEKAIVTPPSWPDTRRPATWICATCYRPPGRHERFTDEGLNKGSITSWK